MLNSDKYKHFYKNDILDCIRIWFILQSIMESSLLISRLSSP